MIRGAAQRHEARKLAEENTDVSPEETRYNVPFHVGDIVFTAGTSSGEATYKKLLNTKKQIGYRYCPVIYDFTPVLLPQVHQKETVKFYHPFLEFNAEMADFIFYGGETARRDGIAYQKEHGLPVPPSCAIKFGSDIHREDEEDERTDEEKADRVKEIFKYYGIKGPYILSVGTMEIRKNYETLYRAYLRMLESSDDVPQMVFAGHPGWKTNDFIATLDRDERVKGKIIHFAPSDEELDVLYKNCEFTVLASLYEGWSLTLPESYWYGKFCLCCDTPALKETAGDLAEYIHGWDEKKWAERIMYYHASPEALKQREKAIAEHWHPISWADCAKTILKQLKEIMENET